MFCAAVKILKMWIKAFYDFFFIIIKISGQSRYTYSYTTSFSQCSFYLLEFTDYCLAVTFYEFGKKKEKREKTTKMKKRQPNLDDILLFSYTGLKDENINGRDSRMQKKALSNINCLPHHVNNEIF